MKGESSQHSRLAREFRENTGFWAAFQRFLTDAPDPDVKTISHPKISKLLDIVAAHFTALGKNSRVMIFSQYRDSVADIVATLNQCPLIKVSSALVIIFGV